MAFFEKSPLIQAGLIKIITADNGELFAQSVITGTVAPLSEYPKFAESIARLSINEAVVLTGELSDPLAYQHLNEVRDLNLLARNAGEQLRTGAGAQLDILSELGLGSLAGKRIEVERLGYSGVGQFKLGSIKGLSAAEAQLHEIQNPNILFQGRIVSYNDLVEMASRPGSNIDPEMYSTFGYSSIRKENATVMRYKYYDDATGSYVYLSARDAETLKVRLGNAGIYNPKKILKDLRISESAVPDIEELTKYDPMKAMGSLNQKIDKRLSALSDKKFALVDTEGLIENVLEGIKTENPELYQRMQRANILPKSLDEVFAFGKTSELRILEATGYRR